MRSRVLRTTDPDDRLTALGLMLGGLGPLAIAALLVPLRNQQLVGVNAVLVFVILVVLAAAAGGRAAGIVAAVVSTMSYDYFLTRPYQSLKIDRASDAVTALLLLAIGLIVAELVSFGARSRDASNRMHAGFARLRRVAELVAGGANIDDVRLSVQAELSALLSLRECDFDTTASSLPCIEPDGAITSGPRYFVGGEFSLPLQGVQLPVVGKGRTFGRLVLIPASQVGVSVAQRRVAVALADQLGAALAAGPSVHRTSEGAS